MTNTDTLTEDDICTLVDAIARVPKKILEVLNTQQENLDGQAAKHLNNLIESINEVKTIVEAETYGMDPNIPLVTQELVSPIKVQI